MIQSHYVFNNDHVHMHIGCDSVLDTPDIELTIVNKTVMFNTIIIILI